MPSRPGLDAYREVWLVDFEFSAPPGERPDPVCLVAREFRSGRTLRLWQDDLRGRRVPPYPIGPDALFVAYLRVGRAGLSPRAGLAPPGPRPGPLRGVPEPDQRPRPAPRDRPLGGVGVARPGRDGGGREGGHASAWSIRGGPWTAAEREALLAYCESDVLALARLLPAMLPELDLPRAVLAGAGTWRPWPGWSGPESRSTSTTLARLRAGWEVDPRSAHRGRSTPGSACSTAGRSRPIAGPIGWPGTGIAWPRLESGELALDDDTFREMARAHPDVALMRELRVSLSQLRLERSGRRLRRPEPDCSAPVPVQDGPEPALQLPSSSSGRRRGSGA